MRQTNIDQSKTLKMLDLPTDTADMYYWCGSDLRIGGPKARDEEFDIPAWSTDCLLTIMKNEGVDVEVFTDDENKWCVGVESYYGLSKEHLIDAVYDAMVWLLSNNKINFSKR